MDGFDVRACRNDAFRRLAREPQQAVTLDGMDRTNLAAALTAFRDQGDNAGGAQTFHERYDHVRAVEALADKLGVTLGHWQGSAVAERQ